MSTPVQQKKTKQSNGKSSWTFLTNHSHVLICLTKNPDMVLREVAYEVGVTERAVQRIVQELEEAGALQRIKLGRQNHYRINRKCKLRHSIENHRTLGELLDVIL